ncbi:hypothetical protein MNV49_003317 [Pseudohyphozyma bogoriensis]|nr:hypothetical protein MNV49_003317 [Pseudohyphozyma bogoriensis]
MEVHLPSTSSTMPSLVASIFDVIQGIINSILAVVQSILHVFETIVAQVFELGKSLIAFVFNNILILGILAVGFVGWTALQQSNRQGAIKGQKKKI